MKKILLFLLFPNLALSQNVIEYFGISSIKKIEIEYSHTMSSPPCKTIILENKTDSVLIQKIKESLQNLPHSQIGFKKFDKKTPTKLIKLIDQKNMLHELKIYGPYLRSPFTEGSPFFPDVIHSKFHKELAEIEKRKKKG